MTSLAGSHCSGIDVPRYGPLCANVTQFTKPEVHNVSQRRETGTELWLLVTGVKYLVKIGRVVPEIRSRTGTQRRKQIVIQTKHRHSYRDRVTVIINNPTTPCICCHTTLWNLVGVEFNAPLDTI